MIGRFCLQSARRPWTAAIIVPVLLSFPQCPFAEPLPVSPGVTVRLVTSEVRYRAIVGKVVSVRPGHIVLKAERQDGFQKFISDRREYAIPTSTVTGLEVRRGISSRMWRGARRGWLPGGLAGAVGAVILSVSLRRLSDDPQDIPTSTHAIVLGAGFSSGAIVGGMIGAIVGAFICERWEDVFPRDFNLGFSPGRGRNQPTLALSFRF